MTKVCGYERIVLEKKEEKTQLQLIHKSSERE